MTATIPPETGRFPAPWNLSGAGYILLFRFSRDFSLEHGFIPGPMRERFAGGMGCVMIVDYRRSNAGPYRELLFIPGAFNINGRRRYAITKIYVSTEGSMVAGRENWGIPKEPAEFSFERSDARTERIAVAHNGIRIFDMLLRAGRIPFPVTTALLPFPLTQLYEGRDYHTAFAGRGWARLARICGVIVNHDHFPDIMGFEPFLALRVDPFSITFPPAVITGDPS